MPFKKASELEAAKFLTLAVSAMEKGGKSRWGAMTPRECGIISVDQSVEDILGDIPNRETCHIATHDYEKVMQRIESLGIEQKKTVARQFLDGIIVDYDSSLSKYRTTVVDTETELTQIVRLAHFGKLSQVKPQHYDKPYAELRMIWRRAIALRKNLVILRKMEIGFESKIPEPKGFKEVPFIIQANLALRFEDRTTVLKVVSTRFNRLLTGQEFKETDYLTMTDISSCVADLQDAEITANPVNGSTPFLRSFQGNCFAAMAKRLRPEIPLKHWL